MIGTCGIIIKLVMPSALLMAKQRLIRAKNCPTLEKAGPRDIGFEGLAGDACRRFDDVFAVVADSR